MENRAIFGNFRELDMLMRNLAKGGDKRDRIEWALVSKSNGRVLKWFGPTKPSKDQVSKEERRVHSFADDVSIYMEKTSGVELQGVDPERQKRIDEIWRKDKEAQEAREAAYQEWKRKRF